MQIEDIDIDNFKKYVDENGDNKDFQHLLFVNLLSRNNKNRIIKENERNFLDLINKIELFPKSTLREDCYKKLIEGLYKIDEISFYDINILYGIVSYALRYQLNYFH